MVERGGPTFIYALTKNAKKWQFSNVTSNRSAFVLSGFAQTMASRVSAVLLVSLMLSSIMFYEPAESEILEKNNNLLGMIKHLEAIKEIEEQENTDPQSREFIENNIKLIELYRNIVAIFYKAKDYQSEFLYRQKTDALISTMPHIYQEDFELIKAQIKNDLVSTSITLSRNHMSNFDIKRSQKYIQIADKKLKEIKTLNISEGQLEIELSKQITKNHEWLTDTKGRLKKLTH